MAMPPFGLRDPGVSRETIPATASPEWTSPHMKAGQRKALGNRDPGGASLTPWSRVGCGLWADRVIGGGSLGKGPGRPRGAPDWNLPLLVCSRLVASGLTRGHGVAAGVRQRAVAEGETGAFGEERAQAADAFADFVFGRVAVRQAHAVATATVRVERRAGDVRHLAIDRLGEEAGGVDPRRGYPHVEPAVGRGPAGARGELALQRVQHGVAPCPVDVHQRLQVGPPPVAGQVPLGDELRQRAGAEVGRLLRQHQAVEGARFGKGPPHADSRREDLRQRPQVDDVARVHRPESEDRIALEPEHPVRVVLDDGNRGSYAENALIAPTYDGSSTTTSSPASTKILPIRSSAC